MSIFLMVELLSFSKFEMISDTAFVFYYYQNRLPTVEPNLNREVSSSIKRDKAGSLGPKGQSELIGPKIQ